MKKIRAGIYGLEEIGAGFAKLVLERRNSMDPVAFAEKRSLTAGSWSRFSSSLGVFMALCLAIWGNALLAEEAPASMPEPGAAANSTAIEGIDPLKRLVNYTEILSALRTGFTVRAVFDYKDCQLISDNEVKDKVPDAVGGMDLTTFEYFAPGSIRNKLGFVASSHSVLINHPSFGVVLNYAKVKISEDGKVRIVAQYIDPKTYEVKMNESFYTTISDGSRPAERAGAGAGDPSGQAEGAKPVKDSPGHEERPSAHFFLVR